MVCLAVHSRTLKIHAAAVNELRMERGGPAVPHPTSLFTGQSAQPLRRSARHPAESYRLEEAKMELTVTRTNSEASSTPEPLATHRLSHRGLQICKP